MRRGDNELSHPVHTGNLAGAAVDADNITVLECHILGQPLPHG
jgi:hypothetical protein